MHMLLGKHKLLVDVHNFYGILTVFFFPLPLSELYLGRPRVPSMSGYVEEYENA